MYKLMWQTDGHDEDDMSTSRMGKTNVHFFVIKVIKTCSPTFNKINQGKHFFFKWTVLDVSVLNAEGPPIVSLV